MAAESRPRHPLAPLTKDEVAHSCRVALSSCVSADRLVVTCSLVEPPKRDVWAWADESLPRRTRVVVHDRSARHTVVALVDLSAAPGGELMSSQVIDGVQAALSGREWGADGDAIKADAGFRAALARRGITDVERLQIDPWPGGNFGTELDASGRRFGRGVAYVQAEPGDNAYARPIENLVAIVDRDTHEVIEIQDGEPVPVPADAGRYDAATLGRRGPLRELADLRIEQPAGSGVSVDDGAVSWGPWRLRATLDPMEGLVLHQICYVDGERTRPVVYRAGLSEMVVPYGSTALNHWWKNAFDAGEVGIGRQANSLELGCDCVGEILYLDAVMADEDGEPTTIADAICLHEEDYGMLWKHVDLGTHEAEVRRSRRLVVSSISTVGNYEYGFYWYFYLDGTIQAEVKLTGIIQTQAVRPGERVPFANPVTTDLAGPHHQHLFNFRLDMCVDGPRNSVYEVDAVPVRVGPDNPHGNAFDAEVTLLERESDGQRMAAADRSRYWKVVNPSSRNAIGEPVGYALVPTHAGSVLLADPSSAIARRAAFSTKHLWVTPFDAEERHAAGEFPNHHPGGDGLPAWTAADRPIVDTDVVLWHTLGTTHFVRPEDFPVMPCEYVGFTLKPVGFFDRNPGLDLAPPRDHCRS